jgi:hypothetical protein
MAHPAYYWEWSKHTFSMKVNLDDVYSRIASDPTLGLETLGYSDIKYSTDLHAAIGDCIVAVVYLQIGGNEFWRVVSCAGNGSEADCQTNVNAVLGTIKILETDYF